MMEIRSKARRLKSREPNLGLIVVDYLQLMTSGANVESRVQEVSADLPLAEDPRARPRRTDPRHVAAHAPSSSATTSARSSPTCASPARSSRTPTW
jgi:hypothetical protein